MSLSKTSSQRERDHKISHINHSCYQVSYVALTGDNTMTCIKTWQLSTDNTTKESTNLILLPICQLLSTLL